MRFSGFHVFLKNILKFFQKYSKIPLITKSFLFFMSQLFLENYCEILVQFPQLIINRKSFSPLKPKFLYLLFSILRNANTRSCFSFLVLVRFRRKKKTKFGACSWKKKSFAPVSYVFIVQKQNPLFHRGRYKVLDFHLLFSGRLKIATCFFSRTGKDIMFEQRLISPSSKATFFIYSNYTKNLHSECCSLQIQGACEVPHTT